MSRTLASARNIQELDCLVDLIHDDWFWTSDLEGAENATSVDLPLYAQADVRERLHPRSCLVIKHVLGVELFDDAHIGAVDINEIAYLNGKVILESGFPVRVEFLVEDLHIELLSRTGP